MKSFQILSSVVCLLVSMAAQAQIVPSNNLRGNDSSGGGETIAQARRISIWPVQNVRACNENGTTLVTWNKVPLDSVIGYDVYKCRGTPNAFEVSTTTFRLDQTSLLATRLAFLPVKINELRVPQDSPEMGYCIALVTYYGSYEPLTIPVKAAATCN